MKERHSRRGPLVTRRFISWLQLPLSQSTEALLLPSIALLLYITCPCSSSVRIPERCVQPAENKIALVGAACASVVKL